MAYDYSVHGAFVFETAKACRDALAGARELLDGEDTDFAELVAEEWKQWFRVDGATVNVAIDLSGPGDWWFALEALIYDVSDDAVTGFVDALHESAPGLITRYHAGGDEEELET